MATAVQWEKVREQKDVNEVPATIKCAITALTFNIQQFGHFCRIVTESMN